jgi:hypothetical protein
MDANSGARSPSFEARKRAHLRMTVVQAETTFPKLLAQ